MKQQRPPDPLADKRDPDDPPEVPPVLTGRARIRGERTATRLGADRRNHAQETAHRSR